MGLKSLLDFFCYASHEWPAGILWGSDGAILDQCNEIMSEVTLARGLDRECAYASSIDEFESKLKQYQERLTGGPADFQWARWLAPILLSGRAEQELT
jgi:hypothetical protein